MTAAIFHRRAALACPLVISCNRSTLSTHYGLFKVSTGERRGEERKEKGKMTEGIKSMCGRSDEKQTRWDDAKLAIEKQKKKL